MRLSREKMTQLSHLIVNGLMDEEGIGFFKDDNDVRLEIFNIINDELMLDDQLDKNVRQKLASYSRPIMEGTREWDVMYRKLYEEELNRMGRA